MGEGAIIREHSIGSAGSHRMAANLSNISLYDTHSERAEQNLRKQPLRPWASFGIYNTPIHPLILNKVMDNVIDIFLLLCSIQGLLQRYILPL